MRMRMKQKKDVYIAGAGKFGKTVLQMLETYANAQWNVSGFLDNDKSKQANNRVVIFLIVFLFINRNRANQVVLFIGDIYFI